MALRRLRIMSAGGDDTLAEWDTETVSPEELQKVEVEYWRYYNMGWFAADVKDRRDVLIDKFDPHADILLIPRTVFRTRRGGGSGC